jgi:hypothetical protein
MTVGNRTREGHRDAVQAPELVADTIQVAPI